MKNQIALLVVLGIICSAYAGDEPADLLSSAALAKIGHSAHGSAFDEGPRQRPVRLQGIGQVHFPITTTVPEVQEWFDQGMALMHSFWFYEAERAFRWCLKLDPDCTMAYWGLAQTQLNWFALLNVDRGYDFLKEAVRRKDRVSRRERLYIEAWAHAFAPLTPDAKGDSGQTSMIDLLAEYDRKHKKLADKLEMIVLEFPDDVEAMALHGLYSIRTSGRYANDLVLQKVLDKAPEHPGAHHYRIHNWDGPEGAQALESCAVYGRIAPTIGHANHMPGHIYSGIGMWHEAAIWMDSATRVEKRHMQTQLTFPFNNGNYAHNRNYLSYIQEQLGMRTAALDGARQLLAAPLDPKYNNADKGGYIYSEGITSMIRGLVKFERWNDILEPGNIPWRDTFEHKCWRAYSETLAHVGLGQLPEASERLAELKGYEAEALKPESGLISTVFAMQRREAEGLLTLAKGQQLKGFTLLGDAAVLETQLREAMVFSNDPAYYPRPLYNVVGEAYLQYGIPLLAVNAFENVLKYVRNDAFALAGLTQAHYALGERDKATEYYGRLLHVWSDADPELRWIVAARKLGLEAQPIDESPATQRNYKSQILDAMGPEVWEPYAAPSLKALGAEGEWITLDQYRGKNVLLIFYLGAECPHCMTQLIAIKKRINDFLLNNTVVLAISSATLKQQSASSVLGNLGFRLLSDKGHANARRFHSYDDFEDMELHSTILIDKRGRVRWARTGGDPFMNLDFLVSEIKRVNDMP